jgi:chemotaxis protein CheD
VNKILTVGIGEYITSKEANEILITYALGSCVAFVIHCPVTKNTAMAHIVLPQADRNLHYKHVKDKPGYYADLIVPKLVTQFLMRPKCEKNKLKIFLAGGAESLSTEDVFHVGLRNVAMIQKQLKKFEIKPTKMEVGGAVSRTVEVSVDNGDLKIKANKRRFISEGLTGACWTGI